MLNHWPIALWGLALTAAIPWMGPRWYKVLVAIFAVLFWTSFWGWHLTDWSVLGDPNVPFAVYRDVYAKRFMLQLANGLSLILFSLLSLVGAFGVHPEHSNPPANGGSSS